ncbi:MAG: hypothetical protein ACOZCL_08020 [Bacillota bacterium]
MVKLSEQYSSSTQNVSAAVKERNASMDEISTAAVNLDALAKSKRVVSEFKL